MAGGNYTAVGGATGELAGSIIAALMTEGNYREIARLRAEAMKRFGDISLPALEAIAHEEMGPSRYNDVQMDQQYKGAADDALQRLMKISSSQGMDPQAQAQLMEAKNAGLGVARGLEGAAMTRLARRGQLSTGARATAALNSQQAGADRAYQGSVRTAADASNRALQALMAAGSMARGMGQADLAQKNLGAGADDRIAQFNIGNRLATKKFNRGLENQRFRNAMGKAGAMNQRSDVEADDSAAAADRTTRQVRGIGKGAGAIIGSGGDWFEDYYSGKFSGGGGMGGGGGK